MTTETKVWKNTPIPGVKVKVLDTEEGHALSAKLFNEMDRNCNTCKNLVRLGLRRGSCTSASVRYTTITRTSRRLCSLLRTTKGRLVGNLEERRCVDFDVKVRKVQDVVMFLKGCPNEDAARDNPYAYCTGQSPVPGGKSYYVLEVNEPHAV